jgi:ABC-type microcin C transport system permease subunit YejE
VSGYRLVQSIQTIVHNLAVPENLCILIGYYRSHVGLFNSRMYKIIQTMDTLLLLSLYTSRRRCGDN